MFVISTQSSPCLFLGRVYTAVVPRKSCGLADLRRESSQHEGSSYGFVEGCPICDYPLPHFGSPVPPPHYPLQHRLVMDAVRRRLAHRVLCCDLCPEEVQVCS